MKPTIYKKTDIPWIPEIPKHWEVRKLKYLINNFVGGGTPNTGNPIYWSDDKNNGYPWVSISDITNSTIINETKKNITQEGINNSSATLIKPNTILYSIYASLGKVALTKVKCTTNQAILAIEENENLIDKNYLIYSLKNIGDAIMQLSNTNTQNNINLNIFKNLKIPVPPLSEQKAIAHYLDNKVAKIKTFIQNKTRLIALLKEKRQAVINVSVTKGKKVRIKNLVTINDEVLSEKTDKDYQLKYIDIGNVKSDGSITKIQTLNFKDAPSRARRIVRKGDVIISTVRTYLQAITRIETDEDNLIVSTGFAVLRPKKDINSEYLNYALRSDKFIEDVIKNSFGVNYPAINSTTLSGLSINIVLEEKKQTQIASYIKAKIEKIDLAIAKTEKEIALIKEYKEAMIAEAVVGKLNHKIMVNERK